MDVSSAKPNSHETALLNDMIPYRCPKCGSLRRFSALKDLKHHLEVEHSFKMGCVKPRSRTKVFSHSDPDESLSRALTGKYIKTKNGGKFSPRSASSDSEEHRKNSKLLMQSYDQQTKLLEYKVRQAKEIEFKNKLNRNVLIDKSQQSAMKQPQPRGDNFKETLTSQQSAMMQPQPRGDNFKETLTNMSKNLLKSRQQQFSTSEALYQAHGVMLGVEQAAENHCSDQQNVIQDLINDLRQKEDQLTHANGDLEKLQGERDDLLKEMETLCKNADQDSKSLKKELHSKEDLLDSVNDQLELVREQTTNDMERKDGELVKAQKIVNTLEGERQRLHQETTMLLQQADHDRALLQRTLDRKERQLRKVNRNMEILKAEQEDLLQESLSLYEKANDGSAKLRHLVQAKDNQLQEAYMELESIKEVHKALISQSQDLTQQADVNNKMLTDLLDNKVEELNKTKDELAKVKDNNTKALSDIVRDKESELVRAQQELIKVKVEKEKLEEKAQVLEKRSSHHDNQMGKLEKLVGEKEEQLSKTEEALGSLKAFITDTAEKEVTARSKLEKFINNLIDRADKAEVELERMRSQSATDLDLDLSRSQSYSQVKGRSEVDRKQSLRSSSLENQREFIERKRGSGSHVSRGKKKKIVIPSKQTVNDMEQTSHATGDYSNQPPISQQKNIITTGDSLPGIPKDPQTTQEKKMYPKTKIDRNKEELKTKENEEPWIQASSEICLNDSLDSADDETLSDLDDGGVLPEKLKRGQYKRSEDSESDCESMSTKKLDRGQYKRLEDSESDCESGQYKHLEDSESTTHPTKQDFNNKRKANEKPTKRQLDESKNVARRKGKVKEGAKESVRKKELEASDIDEIDYDGCEVDTDGLLKHTNDPDFVRQINERDNKEGENKQVKHSGKFRLEPSHEEETNDTKRMFNLNPLNDKKPANQPVSKKMKFPFGKKSKRKLNSSSDRGTPFVGAKLVQVADSVLGPVMHSTPGNILYEGPDDIINTNLMTEPVRNGTTVAEDDNSMVQAGVVSTQMGEFHVNKPPSKPSRKVKSSEQILQKTFGQANINLSEGTQKMSSICPTTEDGQTQINVDVHYDPQNTASIYSVTSKRINNPKDRLLPTPDSLVEVSSTQRYPIKPFRRSKGHTKGEGHPHMNSYDELSASERYSIKDHSHINVGQGQLIVNEKVTKEEKLDDVVFVPFDKKTGKPRKDIALVMPPPSKIERIISKSASVSENNDQYVPERSEEKFSKKVSASHRSLQRHSDTDSSENLSANIRSRKEKAPQPNKSKRRGKANKTTDTGSEASETQNHNSKSPKDARNRLEIENEALSEHVNTKDQLKVKSSHTVSDTPLKTEVHQDNKTVQACRNPRKQVMKNEPTDISYERIDDRLDERINDRSDERINDRSDERICDMYKADERIDDRSDERIHERIHDRADERINDRADMRFINRLDDKHGLPRQRQRHDSIGNIELIVSSSAPESSLAEDDGYSNGDDDNSLSDVASLSQYENLEEPDEIEEGNFEEFMDENGIMWEEMEVASSQSDTYVMEDDQSESFLPHHSDLSSSPLTQPFSLKSNQSQPDSRRFSPYGSEVGGDVFTPINKFLPTKGKIRMVRPSVRGTSISPTIHSCNSKPNVHVRFNNDSLSKSAEDLDNCSRSSDNSRKGQGHKEKIRSVDNLEFLNDSPNHDIGTTCRKDNYVNSKKRGEILLSKSTNTSPETMPFIIRSRNYQALQRRKLKGGEIKQDIFKHLCTESANHNQVKMIDRGCQPIRDSSTQTWMLDTPLDLNEVQSISDRSSFVKSRFDLEPLSSSSSSSDHSSGGFSPRLRYRGAGIPPSLPSSCRLGAQGMSSPSSASKSVSFRKEIDSDDFSERLSLNSQHDVNKDLKGLKKSLDSNTDQDSASSEERCKQILCKVESLVAKFERSRNSDSVSTKDKEKVHNNGDKFDIIQDQFKALHGAFIGEKIADVDGESSFHGNHADLSANESDTDRVCKSVPTEIYQTPRSNDSSTLMENSSITASRSRFGHKDDNFDSSSYNGERKPRLLNCDTTKGNNSVSDLNTSQSNGRFLVQQCKSVPKDTKKAPGSNNSGFVMDNKISEQSSRSPSRNYDTETELGARDHTDFLDLECRSLPTEIYRTPDSNNSSLVIADSGDYRQSIDTISSNADTDLTDSKSHLHNIMDRDCQSVPTEIYQTPKSDDSCSLLEDIIDDSISKCGPKMLSPKRSIIKGQTFDKRDVGDFNEKVSQNSLMKSQVNYEDKMNETGNTQPLMEKKNVLHQSCDSIINSHEGQGHNLTKGNNDKRPALETFHVESIIHSPESQGHNITKESVYQETAMATFHVEDDDDDMQDEVMSTLSGASSMESLLDHLPRSRREEIRNRRRTLYHIFRHLDTLSLGRVALVCREWKKVSRQSSLWKRVHLSNMACTSEHFKSISTYSTKMECLHLQDLRAKEKSDGESEEEYIQSIRASLEPGLEQLLQVSEAYLKSITIVNCPHILTDKSVWLASCYSRLLQRVCYHSNTHSLGPDAMWALGAGCGLINHLSIPPMFPSLQPDKFNNKCLQIISQCLPDLELLEIGGPKVDINGLILIAKSCQRLQLLALHHTAEMTEDVAVAICRMGLHGLRRFLFNHTLVTAPAVSYIYRNCKHLREIQITLSFSDMNFDENSTDKTKKNNMLEFNDRVKDLEGLKFRPGLGNILHLNFVNDHKPQEEIGSDEYTDSDAPA